MYVEQKIVNIGDLVSAYYHDITQYNDTQPKDYKNCNAIDFVVVGKVVSYSSELIKIVTNYHVDKREADDHETLYVIPTGAIYRLCKLEEMI